MFDTSTSRIDTAKEVAAILTPGEVPGNDVTLLNPRLLYHLVDQVVVLQTHRFALKRRRPHSTGQMRRGAEGEMTKSETNKKKAAQFANDTTLEAEQMTGKISFILHLPLELLQDLQRTDRIPPSHPLPKTQALRHPSGGAYHPQQQDPQRPLPSFSPPPPPSQPPTPPPALISPLTPPPPPPHKKKCAVA